MPSSFAPSSKAMKESPPALNPSKTSSSDSTEGAEESLKKALQKSQTSLTQTTEALTSVLKQSVGRSNAITKKSKSVLATWEGTIGGREQLCEVLSLATLDLRQQHFLRLLEDPANADVSLAQVIKNSGMTPSAVIELFNAASHVINNSLVAGQIKNALPSIVQDMAQKSVDAWVECPECGGTGEGYSIDPEDSEQPCMRCRGKKVIFRPSNLDTQKVLLEAGGITKKGGGVNVNVQQNNMNTSMPTNSFSKSMKSTDNLAYESAEVIEGEVKNEQ